MQEQPALRAGGPVDVGTEQTEPERVRAWGTVVVLAMLVGWAGTRR